MKTAILFSGTSYNCKFSLPSLMENLVIPNDADVFIVTSRSNSRRRVPTTVEDVSSDDPEAWSKKAATMEKDFSPLSAVEMNLLTSVFKERLKRILYIEDDPAYEAVLFRERYRMMKVVNNHREQALKHGRPASFGGNVMDPNNGNIRCVVDQYNHIKRCFELMESYERQSGFRYDYVVRARLDFMAPEKLDISHYYLNQDHPYLYVCGSFRRDPMEWADEFCFWAKRITADKLFPHLDQMGFVTDSKLPTVYNNNEYLFSAECQFSLLLHRLKIPCINARIYRSSCFNRGGDGYDYLNYVFQRFRIDLEYEYKLVCQGPSDINEHLPAIRELASRCNHVTELGTRYGNSTVAFMHARPEKFVSYDVTYNSKIDYLKLIARECGVNFEFRLENPTSIEPTDLLFIDTNHNVEQCEVELRMHADKVRRYLVFHDTTTFWEKGQGHERGGGLRYAIEPFSAAHPEWKEIYWATNNNGLLVLERV